MSQTTSTAIPQAFRLNRPVLAAVFGLHLALLALIAMAPAPRDDRPDITPPAPLQMVTVELITPAVPLPMGPSDASPQAPALSAPAAMPQPRPIVREAAAPAAARAPVAASASSAPTASSSLPTTQSATAITTEAAPSSGGGEKASGPATVASAAPVSSVGTEATTPPRFGAAYLNNPAPKYPAIARRMGQQGKVLLRVLVTPAGTAKEVRLYSSSGSDALDDSAMAAVKRWRFVPARQGSNPVEAWVQVPIVFKLD